MKRLTLALLATLVGAGSVLAFTPNANAESRSEYCEHHRCDDYHYNRDRDRDRYERERYERERYRREQRAERWYDRRAGVWRYRDR